MELTLEDKADFISENWPHKRKTCLAWLREIADEMKKVGDFHRVDSTTLLDDGQILLNTAGGYPIVGVIVNTSDWSPNDYLHSFRVLWHDGLDETEDINVEELRNGRYGALKDNLSYARWH